MCLMRVVYDVSCTTSPANLLAIPEAISITSSSTATQCCVVLAFPRVMYVVGLTLWCLNKLLILFVGYGEKCLYLYAVK